MPAEPFLRVTALRKTYGARTVLDNVSLTLERDRTLAVVGPSGSGKTTLARCLARFETPDSGEIALEGRDLRTLPRSAIQLILQQPAASLNPRFTAGQIVAEPLVIRKQGTRQDRSRRAREAMQSVGIDPAASGKPALAFSGGERQRLAIARALALEPKLLILDESLGSLDLSIQAQIANLLLDLQQRLGIAYILISHDLTTVAPIADEIAVMDAGGIVEQGRAAELLASPQYAVTRRLVDANLALSPDR
jgi:peptide/nickel transport system ATP-binding protein